MPEKDFLDQIKVAAPCTANWESMSGDERTRFCGGCRKHVYNISAMSRGEAEELVQRTEGKICVRFYQRKDGKVLTDNCPVGLRRIRDRIGKIVVAVASVFGATLINMYYFQAASVMGMKQPMEPHQQGTSPLLSKVIFSIRDIQEGESIPADSLELREMPSNKVPYGAWECSESVSQGVAKPGVRFKIADRPVAKRRIPAGSIILERFLEDAKVATESHDIHKVEGKR